MTAHKKTVGIIVGGGPAPGINGVISSVTIEAVNNGFEVLGFYDGFTHLAEGKPVYTNLKIAAVSRIQGTGGSILRTARVNPTKDPKKLEAVVQSLRDLNVTHLVTIGGDDTAFSSAKVADHAMNKMGIDLKICHVPKTIDNDLPLPDGVPTFGFQTAREVGTQLMKNLAEDAKTTGRWYLAVVMGRTAGHLALGVAKSAGATITLIPEDFTTPVRITHLADIIATAIIKRLAVDQSYGVAVLAEGLIEKIVKEDFANIDGVERDEHGHIRMAEVNFSDIMKKEVQKILKEFKLKTTVVDKEIGYELRCAPPVAFDIEYTRNLGYAAMEFLIGGGTKAMISTHNEKIVPIPFDEIRNPETGKTNVRLVNTDSLTYKIARKYMIRLTAADLADPVRLEKFAKVVAITPEAFKKRFGYLVS